MPVSFFMNVKNVKQGLNRSRATVAFFAVTVTFHVRPFSKIEIVVNNVLDMHNYLNLFHNYVSFNLAGYLTLQSGFENFANNSFTFAMNQ